MPSHIVQLRLKIFAHAKCLWSDCCIAVEVCRLRMIPLLAAMYPLGTVVVHVAGEVRAAGKRNYAARQVFWDVEIRRCH